MSARCRRAARALASEARRASSGAVSSPSSSDSLADTAPRVSTEGLQRGSLVGRYVVLELVGSGAMGSVYAAYDPQLDRRVALKLVSGLSGDP
ncbi:MAG: hypothetical protein MUC96_32710, partial [Myxococcaceae bacterium]|nr:hypothetical protein [Myxococcaceae bacterium]